MIALTAGEVLEEHNAPPAATLQILRGEIVLTAVSGDVTLTEGLPTRSRRSGTACARSRTRRCC